MSGKYIVIEGLDGSGKSTQHERLVKKIGAVGVREPGGTEMSEEIRNLIKNKEIRRSPRTNVFLFSAARVELMDQIIRPAIKDGRTVVSDRNWLSTVAYQTSEGVDKFDEIYQLCKLATEEFFEPDLLIFIDTDIETCKKRLSSRGETSKDYFDELGDDYFTKVRKTYLEHIKNLKNYVIIDGNGAPDEVEALIYEAILSNPA